MGHIISENPRLGSIRCKRGCVLVQTDLHRIDDWKAQLATADGDDRRHGLLDRLDLLRTRRPKRWRVGYREDLWWFGQVTRRDKQNQERYQRRWPLQADLAPRCRANLQLRSLHCGARQKRSFSNTASLPCWVVVEEVSLKNFARPQLKLNNPLWRPCELRGLTFFYGARSIPERIRLDL